MVGLDYSSSFIQLCVIDDSAKVLINRPCRNQWQAIVEAVSPLGKVGKVAIEACSGAADLADELVRHAGWHVELAHPHYVAKLKGSPDKSDFTDARLLADLARVGYLPRTWLPPAWIRDLRQLVGHRQQLVDQRRAAKLRIGALLREHRVVTTLSRWSKPWRHFVIHTDQLSDAARFIVQELFDEIDHLSTRILRVESHLREKTKEDVMTHRLMEQEGIGEVTAWILRAFVGEFDRFKNGKQLARYCGMSPKNASSGMKQADAGLIRASNRILRATAVQAAHRLIRTSPRWRALAESMRGRGKAACVIVGAVGNRWLRRLHYEMTRHEKIGIVHQKINPDEKKIKQKRGSNPKRG